MPNKVSREGVKYYNDLIDELLANGIEPLMTMYHWDHPQILEDAGGWTNAEMVDWFADFARVVFKEFGSKVKRFIPLNEPVGFCDLGYSRGLHAPGKKLHGIGEYLCVHNALKAHAKVYRIYQNEFKATQQGEVGFMINSHGYLPKTSADAKSANVAFTFNIGWALNPIYAEEGDYPDLMKKMVANKSLEQGYSKSRLPEFEREWIVSIKYDYMMLRCYFSFGKVFSVSLWNSDQCSLGQV